ncbi:uncharacterized protein CDAR_528261 [Caerostris darwini]|uniref:Uncharacterized protein n=1 Tax=Caerostris darwini TaxID=1538125 RepID=A0AAV4P4G6_9ARAC|nr:uncharacterized protein CDAR_528261 [Caerostris darwini]
MIPKLGYYANNSKEVRKIAQQILFNDTDDIPSQFCDHYETSLCRNVAVTFVQIGAKEYLKCFSENLYLYNKEEEPATSDLDTFSYLGYLIYRYGLNISHQQLFHPWDTPQVFFALHSPFNPINPVFEGVKIKHGYDYTIQIYRAGSPPSRYMETHSGQIVECDIFLKKCQVLKICLELCKKEFFNKCIGCDLGPTMHSTPKDLCNRRHVGCEYSRGSYDYLKSIQDACMRDCRPECVKQFDISRFEPLVSFTTPDDLENDSETKPPDSSNSDDLLQYDANDILE